MNVSLKYNFLCLNKSRTFKFVLNQQDTVKYLLNFWIVLWLYHRFSGRIALYASEWNNKSLKPVYRYTLYYKSSVLSHYPKTETTSYMIYWISLSVDWGLIMTYCAKCLSCHCSLKLKCDNLICQQMLCDKWDVKLFSMRLTWWNGCIMWTNLMILFSKFFRKNLRVELKQLCDMFWMYSFHCWLRWLSSAFKIHVFCSRCWEIHFFEDILQEKNCWSWAGEIVFGCQVISYGDSVCHDCFVWELFFSTSDLLK